MKLIRISRQQVYQRLRHPYNPPDAHDERTKRIFFEEWHIVRDRLLEVLSKFGENDEFDDLDFNLSDNAMLSRGIGVTFTSEKMFKSAVIEAIEEFLRELAWSYEVNVTFQADGMDDHDIFISKEEILAELPDRLFEQIIPVKWKTQAEP